MDVTRKISGGRRVLRYRSWRNSRASDTMLEEVTEDSMEVSAPEPAPGDEGDSWRQQCWRLGGHRDSRALPL